MPAIAKIPSYEPNQIQIQMRPFRVTPEWAAEVLARQDPNRSVKRRNLDRIAESLKNGTFKNIGDPIRFSKSGRLLDGQHRIMACVKANVSFDCFLIEGLDDDDFVIIDSGMSRQASDDLHLLGEASSHIYASSLRYIESYYKKGAFVDQRMVDRSRVMELHQEHPEMVRSIGYGRRLTRILPSSMASALHYILSRIDQDAADEFFTRFKDGVDLGEDHPILTLRNRLIQGRQDKNRKMSDMYQAAIVIQAWNCWRRNLPGHKNRISWSPDKPFPRPV